MCVLPSQVYIDYSILCIIYHDHNIVVTKFWKTYHLDLNLVVLLYIYNTYNYHHDLKNTIAVAFRHVKGSAVYKNHVYCLIMYV